MDTFLILLSLFLIIFAGAGARRFNLLPEEASKYFNKFIFYISVPAVVFLSIATLDKGDLSSFLPFILTNIAVVFTGYILVYFILRYFNISADKKGVLIYSGNGGNVIYFGFPLLLSLYGAEHFNLGVMYATAVITLGDLMGFYLLGINKGGEKLKIKEITRSFLENPVVRATIAGVFVAIINISLPKFFSDSLETLSKTTTGLALFSLGIYLYGKLNFNDFKLALASSFFKLLFLPLIAYLMIYFLFKMTGPAAETSVIMAVMPTAVFSLIVADAYGLDKRLTSNAIVLSSILFLLTSGLWVFILKAYN